MNEYLSRLAYLYKQYANGDCTLEERKEFMMLVSNDESVNELNSLIEQDVADHQASRIIAAPRADMLYNLVLEKGKKQLSDRIRSRRVFIVRRMTIAASVIFLLGIGIYFLFLDKKGNDIAKNNGTQHQKFKTDVAPGGNKAILTLADGSTIVLDNVSNGAITQQGGTNVIKLDNGVLAYNAINTNEAEVLYNTITTPRGGQYQLTLADGSKVWLNAASSLRFPAIFFGKERKVELTGEAYFEIAKNVNMPFKVEVKKMVVQVLGTHFNINSYDDEAVIKTTLLEGAVSVKKDNNLRQLSAGQQAQLNNKGEIELIDNVDTEETIAWKNGKFIFTGNDIQSVMRQLGKWYDIEVEYRGDLTNEEFVGIISRNVNISQILEMLEKTRAVNFEIKDRKVIVQ